MLFGEVMPFIPNRRQIWNQRFHVFLLFLLFLSVLSWASGGVTRRPVLEELPNTGVRCTAPILDRCFFWEGSSAMCTASMFHFCGSVWEGDEIGVAI